MSYHHVLIPLGDKSKYVGEMYLVDPQEEVYISKGFIPRDSLIPSLNAFLNVYKADVVIMSALPRGYKAYERG